MKTHIRGIQTVTTIGFGDITPVTTIERIFAIIYMILGVGFYSFAIGNFSNILLNMDKHAADFKEKIDNFNDFAIKFKVPENLRLKIHNFFELIIIFFVNFKKYFFFK